MPTTSKKQSPSTTDQPAAQEGGRPLEADVCAPLTLADIVDISCFSRDAAKRLPSEREIESSCTDESIKPIILERSRLVRYMAGETGQPNADELHAVLIRLHQIDAMMAIVGAAEKASCIQTAENDKQACKLKCGMTGRRICGCLWNSFLAKTNCFVSIKVGVDVP